MPNYDYVCFACGQRVEVYHRIHEVGPGACAQCGADGSMRKGIVTTAVHFKGSGWAKKDRSAGASTGKTRTADGEAASAANPSTADAAPSAPGDSGSTSTSTATTTPAPVPTASGTE